MLGRFLFGVFFLKRKKKGEKEGKGGKGGSKKVVKRGGFLGK